MWGLWWIKWHCDRSICGYVGFPYHYHPSFIYHQCYAILAMIVSLNNTLKSTLVQDLYSDFLQNFQGCPYAFVYFFTSCQVTNPNPVESYHAHKAIMLCSCIASGHHRLWLPVCGIFCSSIIIWRVHMRWMFCVLDHHQIGFFFWCWQNFFCKRLKCHSLNLVSF